MSSNNEYESLPNIDPLMKKNSMASTVLNASNIVNNNNINLNNSSDCDSIISLRDEKSPERKAFFDKIYKTKHDSKSILNVAKELNGNIGGLDGKINSILTRHHKDYIATFNEFMDTVKKDLREKMENLEKMDKEKKKNDDLDIVKTERDFFRQEAIRLNELCRELSNTTDDLIRENKAKAAEIKYLTKKFKESENTNKQLFAELQENIKIIANYENEKKQFLKMHRYYEFLNSNLNTNFNNDNNNNNKLNNYYSNNYLNNIINNNKSNSNYSSMPNLNNLYNSSFEHSNNNNKNTNNSGSAGSLGNIIQMNLNNSSSYNIQNNSTEDIDFMASQNYNSLVFDSQREKERVIQIIEKLRAELKKEKNRNQKFIGEFNKILIDKKKLEKIFLESVEECRREILQRKMRDTMNSTKTGFFGIGKKAHFAPQSFPILNEVKFEHFQATDKKKLLENFLMRDEIINFIKENLTIINAEQKGPFLQKNLSESIFGFRQSMSKFDSKLYTSSDFTKSKNGDKLGSSSRNLGLLK